MEKITPDDIRYADLAAKGFNKIGHNANRLIEEHIAAIAAPVGLTYSTHIDKTPGCVLPSIPSPNCFNPVSQ